MHQQACGTQTEEEAAHEGCTVLQLRTVPPSCESAVKSLPLYMLPRVLLPGTVLTNVPSANNRFTSGGSSLYLVLQQSALDTTDTFVHVYALCRGK
jgi:hypothetical protein